MKKKDLIVLILLTLVLVAAVLTTFFIIHNKNQTALEESVAGRALSATSTAEYTDLKGNPVDLEMFLGQPLIVFSWASWCPSCATQLSMLEAFAEERGNVTILAINRAEPLTTVEQYISYARVETGGSVTFVLDKRDHFYKTVGGYAAPETVIFDTEGNISHHLRGDISIDTLRSTIPVSE